jgi:VanZ family protein
MAIIFLASATPGKVLHDIGFTKESYHIDGHFTLYFFLCIAYYKATKSIFKSLLLTLFYGITDEIHQAFVPLRSASMFDILVDALGGLLAGGLIWKFKPLLPKKLKNWLVK